MVYQMFTTLLKWKPTRRLLQYAKKHRLFQSMIPMVKEWYEKDYIYQYPHASFLGWNALNQFGEFLDKQNFHNPLIVTDPILIKTGVVAHVIKELENNQIKHVIFDGVKPNPSIDVVNEIVNTYHTRECDALISVGGGSAHDAVKGASLVISNVNTPIRKFQGLNVTCNVSKMPIIAINTTAGTGSGVTNVAVITDEQNHFKMTLVDKNIQPHVLVNDTQLMMGLPVTQSMWVGVDTLVHAIEAELSVYGHNLFVKSYARQAMRLVYRFLPAVYENSQDKQAREKMAYAEFMAGVAFNSASLGFIHSLSHAMSGVFNTPHGLANAVLMPYVLDYELNFKKVVSKLSKIGDYMDIDLISSDEFGKAKEVVREIVAFLKKLGIPSTLKDVQPNISKNQIREMASKAMKDFCGISNPVQFSKKEVIHIYKNAIAGKFENI